MKVRATTTPSTSTTPRATACSSSARWTRSAGTARAGRRSSGSALPSKTSSGTEPERFAKQRNLRTSCWRAWLHLASLGEERGDLPGYPFVFLDLAVVLDEVRE